MRKHFAALTVLSLLIASAPISVAAAPIFHVVDTTVTVGNKTFIIKAGSVREQLDAGADSLTVSVPASEALILVSPAPDRWVLENDGLLPTCTVLDSSKDNWLLISGPKTVTIRPGEYHCSSATTYNKPMASFSQPAAGATLKSGDQYQIFWQMSGNPVPAVRLRLSTDGGSTFPLTLAESENNNGFFQWTVPTLVTTDNAYLKLDGIDGSGSILALAMSHQFTIQGITAQEEAQSHLDYNAETATAAAVSISVNQDFYLAVGDPEPICPAGLLVKAASNPAVYYCGADGKRHAFPNQRIYDSWYVGDFAGVVTVSDEELAKIRLGRNVTYRPGVRLVKIQTDPKVYAVDADGVLRWVPSEETARLLYGDNWNQKVDDVPDAFFADYEIGEQVVWR